MKKSPRKNRNPFKDTKREASNDRKKNKANKDKKQSLITDYSNKKKINHTNTEKKGKNNNNAELGPKNMRDYFKSKSSASKFDIDEFPGAKIKDNFIEKFSRFSISNIESKRTPFGRPSNNFSLIPCPGTPISAFEHNKQTPCSMINTEEVEVSDNLTSNQGHVEAFMKEQNDKHKNTMIYNMVKYPNLYPKDKETSADKHKYHYTYCNKESRSKSKRKKLPFEYVRLMNRSTGNLMYFRAFDEKDIGFSNNEILYKNIILHNRDIDSETNNADLDGSYEKVKDDLKEGFACHALGLIDIENLDRDEESLDFDLLREILDVDKQEESKNNTKDDIPPLNFTK